MNHSLAKCLDAAPVAPAQEDTRALLDQQVSIRGKHSPIGALCSQAIDTINAFETENAALRQMLRDVTATAITLRYQTDQERTVKEFTQAELTSVLLASVNLQRPEVEKIYRRAFDSVLDHTPISALVQVQDLAGVQAPAELYFV